MLTSPDQLNLSPQQRRLYQLEDKLRMIKMLMRSPSQSPGICMATRSLQAAYLWPMMSSRLISEAEDVMEHAVEVAIHDAVTPRLGLEYENSLSCSTAVAGLLSFEFINDEEAKVLRAIAQLADRDECSAEDVKNRKSVMEARRLRVRNASGQGKD